MTEHPKLRFARNEFRLMCDAKEYFAIDPTDKNCKDDFLSNLIDTAEWKGLIGKWEVEMEQFKAKFKHMTNFEFQQLVAEIDFFKDKDDEDYRTFFNTLPPLGKIFLICEDRGLDFESFILGKNL